MATDTLDLTDVKFDLLVAEYDQHEVACELIHLENECSYNVTHRMAGCVWEGNACEAGASRKQEAIKSGRARCEACKRPAKKCWTIRPI